MRIEEYSVREKVICMKKETREECRYKGFLKAVEEVFDVYYTSKGPGGEMPSLQLGVTNCFNFFAADSSLMAWCAT